MYKIVASMGFVLYVFVGVANASVVIGSQSYQKVIKKKKEVWVKATKVVPGSVVKYLNTLENKGDENATVLIVVNQIPKQMVYEKGSAVCKSACAVTYSIDGGKSFNIPRKLLVKDKKSKKFRVAKTSEYTTIKWSVEALETKKRTSVQYKARIK